MNYQADNQPSDSAAVDVQPGQKQALPIRDGLEARQALAAHEKLFEIYDRMIGDVDIRILLQDIANVVCSDLHAERATVYLVNQETEELESVAMIGNVSRDIRVPIRSSSLAGHCALSGNAFVVPDAYGDLSDIAPDLRFDRTWDEQNNFRTRDVLCAPAMFKGQVVGVVQVINSLTEPFSQDDLLTLRSIARLIGYSLYHAQLYDDLATMKQLEKEKAGFMRVIIHELKSPVAAVKMMTDLLVSFEINHPKAESLHSRIAGRMDEMIQLIQDIFMLAKMKSGDPMGKIDALDLVEEVREACRKYREQAEQKGLTMEIDLPAEPMCVWMDNQGCQLILSNLVSNAVKYTSAGSVRVSLRAENSWAVLEVADSGIGIPQADIPKLFREFFRASNAKKCRIPGSGVGLAGVKNIVERFGGELAFDSIENKGSTFTVRLPIHADA